MLRMSKLTDYGLVLLTHMAQEHRDHGGVPGMKEAGDGVPDGVPGMKTAHELAERSHVPLPTVSKILKELSKAGIVVSHRGRRGGYSLSRPPQQISVAAVLEALEGPVALTECSTTSGTCSLEPVCVAKGHWGPISRAIHRTLARLPLSALGSRPVSLRRPPLPATHNLTDVLP